MKYVLLFCALLGVGLAKPNINKEIVELLKKALEKKDGNGPALPKEPKVPKVPGKPGSGPETTILAGIDPEFSTLPTGIFNFSAPLDGPQLRGVLRDEMGKILSITNDAFQQVNGLFSGLSGSSSADDVRSVFSQIESIEREDEVNTEAIKGIIMLKVMEAAVAGTTGDSQNELPCDFKKKPIDIVECVVTKGYLIEVAQQAIMMKVGAYLQNSGLGFQECKSLFTELSADSTPGEIAEELKNYISCTTSNVDLFTQTLSGGDDMSLVPIPDLLVPRALAAITTIEIIEGQVWEVVVNIIHAASLLPQPESEESTEGEGEGEVKKLLTRYFKFDSKFTKNLRNKRSIKKMAHPFLTSF